MQVHVMLSPDQSHKLQERRKCITITIIVVYFDFDSKQSLFDYSPRFDPFAVGFCLFCCS